MTVISYTLNTTRFLAFAFWCLEAPDTTSVHLCVQVPSSGLTVELQCYPVQLLLEQFDFTLLIVLLKAIVFLFFEGRGQGGVSGQHLDS